MSRLLCHTQTLFNILRFEELDIENAGGADGEAGEGRDRPSNPPRITSTEVLHNPFDDLRPRNLHANKHDDKSNRPKKKQKKSASSHLCMDGVAEAVMGVVLMLMSPPLIALQKSHTAVVRRRRGC